MTLYSESNIHHQPSVLRAVGTTKGSNSAPRITLLKRRVRFSSSARVRPRIALRATDAVEKTMEFCSVCRKMLSPNNSMKLSSLTNASSPSRKPRNSAQTHSVSIQALLTL